jgi:exodeoxyribonuclease VII small subunit
MENVLHVQTPAELTFESAMRELESIVRRLEEGKVDLEDAIVLYERGDMLRSFCDSKLKEAQMRVEKIVENQNGDKTTVPFDNK